MKRLDNPPNPYESQYTEWLGPPPQVNTEVYIDESRSILATNDSPDVSFRWSVNPYRGCQHACAYCYARPTHEYLGLGAGSDFETRIVVKPNAPELLRQAFSRRSWKGEFVAFSGVTDCYQPLEAVWKLTRGCLEVCRDFRNPIGIVTKSYLIVRDAELLAELSRVTSVHVYHSIPFARDDLARKIEPGAPPPSRRFEAMRRLHEAGVPVSVMMAPIIPGLNDTEIPAVLKRAAECGAAGANYIAVRLPGNVAPVFLSRVREKLPERAAHVESRIRQMRSGRLSDPRFGDRMRGTGMYWESVRQLFDTTAKRYGLRSKGERGGLDKSETKAGGPQRRSGPEESEAPAAAALPKATPAAGRQLPLFNGSG